MEKDKKIIEFEDIIRIWSIIKKNWYLLVFLPLLSWVIAYFYAYKLPNIYAASSQILVKNTETYDYQQGIYRNLGYYDIYQNLVNQIRVVKSRDLIKKALDKIDAYVSYYIVGRIRTTEIYSDIPFKVKAKIMNPNIYEKEIFFNVINENKYHIKYELDDDIREFDYEFGKEFVNKDFVIKVTKTRPYTKTLINNLKDVTYFFKVHNRNYLVNHYLNNLNVENEKYTSILTLYYEDEIPERAKQFLDTLAKVYIDYTLESQYLINENTLKYIDRQLKEVMGILSTIEDTLEEYKQEKFILDLPKEENEYFKRLVNFDMQKRELGMRMDALLSLENYILNIDAQKEPFLPSSVYIFDDEYLKKAVNDLYELQMKKNLRLYSATQSNLAVNQVDSTINLLRKNLMNYIINSKKALNDRINSLQDEINHYESVIRQIPKTQRDILNINRKLQVNEKMYLYLLEKRANTIIARAGIVPETKVIEAPRNLGIVKPDKQKIYIAFIGGGATISLLIILIRILFFNKIETLAELKYFTDLPALGRIFIGNENDDGKKYFLITENLKSPVAESFRTLRTNLQYFAPEIKNKTILITSIATKEGKTFCSVNLAIILAKADKKTLLVDLDLHKPRIHKIFSLNEFKGMSSYLIGHLDFNELINKNIENNLDIAPAGPLPPNASELVLNKRMQDFFEKAKQEYEYIIIDTPPIGPVSDAIAIMKYANVKGFVLNALFSRTQELRLLEEIIKSNKIKNACLILNSVKQKRFNYYFGYYNYLYGYGYGYGYGYEEKTN